MLTVFSFSGGLVQMSVCGPEDEIQNGHQCFADLLSLFVVCRSAWRNRQCHLVVSDCDSVRSDYDVFLSMFRDCIRGCALRLALPYIMVCPGDRQQSLRPTRRVQE